MSEPPPLPPPFRPDQWPVARHSQPPSRIKWLLPVVVVLVLVIAGAGGLLYQQRRTTTRVDAPPAVNRAEVVNSFSSTQPTGDPQQLIEIQKMLTEMGKGVSNPNEGTVDRYFDIDRLILEIERLPDPPTMGSENRTAFATGLKQGLKQQFTGSGTLSSWSNVQVRLVRPVSDRPNEVVVVAKLEHPAYVARMRFWMTHTDRWRIYDLEDLDAGLRTSNVMGSLFALIDKPTGPATLAAIQSMGRAMEALRNGKLKTATTEIDSISDSSMPPAYLGMVYMIRSAIAIRENAFEDAQTKVDRAIQLSPDLAMNYLLKSIACNGLRQDEPAVKAGQQYLDMIGPSELGGYQVGRALVRLKRFPEAIKALQSGLLDEPKSADCLKTLAGIDTPEAQAALSQHVKALTLSPLEFRTLCNSLDNDGYVKGLTTVVEVQAAKQGDTIDARFYTATVKEVQGSYAEAAAIYLKDIHTAEKFYIKAVLSRYVACMVELKKPLEAYETAGRPQEAFKLLANQLPAKSPELAQLMAKHLKLFPKDAEAWDANGDWLSNLQKYDEAAAAYDKAVEFMSEDSSIKGLAASRLYAYYKAGKGIQAFRDYPRDVDRFKQLANLTSNDKKPDELRQVIEIHRAVVPDSPLLAVYEAEAAYLDKDYVKVVRILDAMPEVDDYNVKWRRKDRLVRAYVNLKQFKQATKTSFDGTKFADPLQTALIAAAQGDLAATTRAVDAATDDDYEAGELLDDPDLGPLLKTAAFDTIRAKLLKPATQPTTLPATQPLENNM